MKTSSFNLLIALLLTVTSATAGIKLPSSTYVMAELEEAKQEAVSKNKPVAFLYTDKDSTCGLCNNATKIILGELKSRTILVYMDTKKGSPSQVSKALSRKGKYIPKVVVYEPSLENEIGLVIYEEIKSDGKKALRELKKKIHKFGNP